MLNGMEGTNLGIWVAHAEGQYQPEFGDDNKIQLKEGQRCLKYVDSSCHPTESYPENPNGSLEGLTGICSENGRHLAMMPHPERSIFDWQVPWSDPLIKENMREYQYDGFYPWLEMFRNAYRWTTTK